MALITALDNPTPSASFDSAASLSMENVFFLETSATFLVFLAPIQTTQAVGVFFSGPSSRVETGEQTSKSGRFERPSLSDLSVEINVSGKTHRPNPGELACTA